MNSLKDYVPAFVTLIAGLLTFGLTMYISWKGRKQTDKISIQNEKLKLKELQFGLNSKNKQEWMNQFRIASTEFIAMLQLILIGMDVSASATEVNTELKKLLVAKLHVELLLHPSRPDELEILQTMGALQDLVMVPEEKRKEDFDRKVKSITMNVTILCQNLLEKNWKEITNSIENKKPA